MLQDPGQVETVRVSQRTVGPCLPYSRSSLLCDFVATRPRQMRSMRRSSTAVVVVETNGIPAVANL